MLLSLALDKSVLGSTSSTLFASPTSALKTIIDDEARHIWGNNQAKANKTRVREFKLKAVLGRGLKKRKWSEKICLTVFTIKYFQLYNSNIIRAKALVLTTLHARRMIMPLDLQFGSHRNIK